VVRVLEWLAKTWNSVELWITQQPFWLQFVVVMAVLLPLCLGAAWLIDRVVDYVSAKLHPDHEPAAPADDENSSSAERIS
jgi:hypothetical protein